MWTDVFLSSLIAEVLNKKLERHLSENLSSYRRGRGPHQARRKLISYLSLKKKTQNIYVYQADVASYTDNIPVHPQSSLWQDLEDLIKEEPNYIQSLVKKLLRPSIRLRPGVEIVRLYGIPTGSPLCPLIYNLYLNEMDHEITRSFPEAFYNRYGDDIFFAADEPAKIQSAKTLIKKFLDQKEIFVKATKEKTLIFNRAGKSVDNFDGTSCVEFLGFEVNREGAVFLSKRKSSEVYRDVAYLMRNAQNDFERPQEVAEILRNYFDPTHPLRGPHSLDLRFVTTNRSRLKEMDDKILMIVLKEWYGTYSVKNFRLSPARSFVTHKFPSLVHARNNA